MSQVEAEKASTSRCKQPHAVDKLGVMARPPTPAKQTFTVRLAPEQVTRIRAFVRDYAGKPFYLTLHGLVAQAVEREMQRIELIQNEVIADEPVARAHRGDRPASSNHQRR